MTPPDPAAPPPVTAIIRALRLGRARAVLFAAWFIAAPIILGFQFFFVLTGIYGDNADATTKALSWLVPIVGPTLTLISTSFLLNVVERDPADDLPLARPIVFWITLFWSILYFIAVFGVILAAGNSAADQRDNVLDIATTPLSFMQSVLAALLGAFFMTETSRSGSN